MDIKAEKKSLKRLLSVEEQQFRVPAYQRAYSWTTEEVDDLWDDLTDNLNAGHFLGSIVISNEDDSRPEVIDGQQRLTTLLLVLATLRDEYSVRGMKKQASQIGRRFIADDLAEGDSQFKFRTGKVNWQVFRDFVLRNPGDPGRMDDPSMLDKEVRGRNRHLLSNLDRTRSKLANQLSLLSEGARNAWLETFTKTLMERVEFIVIEAGDLADAFLLFETLNDRGLQLSAADLLKSHILGKIAASGDSEGVDEASQRWDGMLEDLGSHVDVTRFLRHYLLGNFPSVKKDEVFDHFKRRVLLSGARHVFDDICAAAVRYGEFENPHRVSHEPTRRVLEDLKTLRAVTCYITLLPARRLLSESDFIQLARLAEVLTFRYSSVVGLGTNELERKYHEAARLILESNGADLEKARTVLINAMPDSEQFLVAFNRLEMGRQYLLKYTLHKIEELLSPSKEKELRTSSIVHIEHIMPQKLSADWKAELGVGAVRHEELLHRYGNLTLFFAGLNIPASNKLFSDKKSYYAKSEVAITQELCHQSSWGPVQIEARQQWLGEIAEKLWRVESPNPSALPEPVASAELIFKSHLGILWPAVEAMVVETSAEEIKQFAEQLPNHLDEHPTHSQEARRLGDELQSLIGDWESFDGHQRAVVRAAVVYFLEIDDGVSDLSDGGLDDDDLVIGACIKALGRQRGPSDGI